ncbi:MAG: recombinase, partial [Candidatus Nanopelagicaceae bacterium]
SGHYHHKSSKGNITYLGNPYQMFWNDYKDERGFHLYDPPTNKLTRVKNPFEIFQKVFYNDVLNEKHVIDESYKDTFVKVVVEEKRDYNQFESMIDALYEIGVHDIKIVEHLSTEDSETDEVNIEVKDTLTLLNEYVDEAEMAIDKTELKKLMRSLYIESCEVA